MQVIMSLIRRNVTLLGDVKGAKGKALKKEAAFLVANHKFEDKNHPRGRFKYVTYQNIFTH